MSRLEDIGASLNGEPDPIVPRFLTAGQMMAEFPDLMEPILDGLLRRGELMNVIASPKVGKTWLILHLIICVASGRMFLNRFRVTRGRVLLIDNELHPGTLAKRLAIVANEMGLLRDDYANNLCIESLRGQSATMDRLVKYADLIGPDRFDLIVIDAFYRTIPRGFDENSNSDMTQMFNMGDQIARTMNAAIVFVHHASKGSQAGKSVTDVGAGAGAQSRAADAHLIIRQHEEDDAVVVDTVARSWAPPEPFGMRWAFPMWTVDDTLDLTHLRQATKRREKAAGSDLPPEPKPEPWTAERFADAFITGEPQAQADIVALASEVGVGRHRAGDLLKIIRRKHLAHVWHFPKTNAVFLANREQLLTDTEAGRD